MYGLFVFVGSAQACEVCESTDLFEDSFCTFSQNFPHHTFIMLRQRINILLYY